VEGSGNEKGRVVAGVSKGNKEAIVWITKAAGEKRSGKTWKVRAIV
jgi:hypothetical protein